jgi:hypothetical protein
VVTLFRRYYELQQTIERIWEMAGEFEFIPEVVVVWAQPELGRLWFIQELLDAGKIQHVISRPKLVGEEPGVATTYPESHNLRLGLQYVTDNFLTEDTYVIGMAADVCPRHGTFAFIDNHIRENAKAVVFHWPNGCCHSGVWHTNFFVVPLDDRFWPPLSGLEHQDVLERQWGMMLSERRLEGVVETHNHNDKRFVHCHQSETQPEWPLVPLNDGNSVGFAILGRKTFWRKLREIVAGVFSR